jgi:hypothetical protein
LNFESKLEVLLDYDEDKLASFGHVWIGTGNWN